MTILQAIILGIVQGITEFLPISSSAHLVLVPYLLGWNIPAEQEFAFDVLVQMGTLVAVIVYFWRDLLAVARDFLTGLFRRQPFATPQARLGWYLILATIPAGLLGITIKPLVEAAFNSHVATAGFLVVTAALLLVADWLGRQQRDFSQVNWLDALVMGLFQAASIFPGVSRSGSTITGGLLRGLDRPAAARFSFLMSIPVMLAAGLLETIDIVTETGVGSQLPVILVGMVIAGVVGYLSIRWLLNYLVRHSLRAFAFYCLGLAAVVLVFSYAFAG